MRYNKKSLSEKQRIVRMVTEEGLSVLETSEKTGVPRSTIFEWLGNPRVNPDREYVRMRQVMREERQAGKAPSDPLPGGVAMASRKDPDEMARENRDLRRKVEYLEDKVAYLEALYEIIVRESPDRMAKKNASRRSASPPPPKEEGM